MKRIVFGILAAGIAALTLAPAAARADEDYGQVQQTHYRDGDGDGYYAHRREEYRERMERMRRERREHERREHQRFFWDRW